MIDDYTIKKIKDAASIVDVVSDFYPIDTRGGLRKMGNEYSCPCPFHGGKHYGSFKVSPKLNIATCFSCGRTFTPINFLMEHEHMNYLDAIKWLGAKYCIEVEGAEDFKVRTAKPREQMPQLPMLILPEWMWKIRFGLSEDNNFRRWLEGIKWDGIQRDRILQALSDYRVGEAKNGMVIWWQIDNEQRVRTGKMMRYRADGHREKGEGYNCDWIHSALYRDPHTGYSADKTDMKSCLFGLHLLDKYKRDNVAQDVCIVESEKTALIMSIAYGNSMKQVWMACGGISNINREKLEPIIAQKRHIILYPDRDGISKWKAKAENLHYDCVSVDTQPVTEETKGGWWRPEDGEKADIADVVLLMIGQKKIYKTVDEIVEDIPTIKKLHEKLNLDIVK